MILRLTLIILLCLSPNAFAVGAPDYLPDGAHPRIWLTSSELLNLAAKRDAADSKWAALETWCDDHIADPNYNVHPANQTTQDLTNWGGGDDGSYVMAYRMSGWAKHLYSYGLAYQVLKQSGTAQDLVKAATYAARARTLLIDGISNTLSAGEETGNGLHALRVGSLHDITINSAEGAVLGLGVAGYKNGYASRFLASVPACYDWIYDTLSTSDKTLLTSMMLRWFDWARGVRSSYNNGVLVNGVRYHEDTDGDCTGTNDCTGVSATASLQQGNDFGNIAGNFGGGYASLMMLIGVATYGDYAEDDTYLAYLKTWVRDTVIDPLDSDILHSGGDSPEGWNYGGGFIYSEPALYGFYTATGISDMADIDWSGDLVRAAAHRVSGDYITVPMWGYWTGVPYKESRIEPVTTFVGIEQKLHPASDESKLGQYLLDTPAYSQSLDEWKNLFFNSTNVTASSPIVLSEPLSYVAEGNGLYASRSSWNDADTVHLTTRLEGKVTTDHEGYDEGHITLLRGDDVLLAHDNADDAPPSETFNTILFNGVKHTTKNVPTSPAIDRYKEGTSYSYVSGDITGAWWYQWGDDYISLFRRSVLHIRPGFVVVYDVTQSMDSRGNLKEWLTQYESDPSESGNTITASVGDSNVFVKHLYPLGSFTETNPETGFYRVKFTPTTTQEYDQFLTVIEAASSVSSQTTQTLIDGTGGRGVNIGGDTIAMFTKDQSGADITSLTYSTDTTAASTHYIADCTVGATYNVSIDSGTAVPYVANDAGLVIFDNPSFSPHNYEITLDSLPTTETSCTDGVDNDGDGDADCDDSDCVADSACVASPTCSDGIQNGDEEGIDCGGSCTACESEPTGSGHYRPIFSSGLSTPSVGGLIPVLSR